jgi:signal recognition particle subunit SRP54
MKVDKEQAAKVAEKVFKGAGFTLDDFADQLKQMKNMGGMMSMLDKLPGMSNLPDAVKGQMGDKTFIQMEAIISSMTKQERARPEIIKGSRKKRIAAGSGTQVQEINKLLKQFTQMQKMMKKMKGKGGMQKMMRGMKGMLPPGMMGGGGPKF